ncbi:MAG TPA: hypothetical protein VK475_11705, partial [Pyrinomonadaceae bacterium]|nr:hypothetical protein [Pyrinomonadaceae bacterium]
MSRIIEWLKSHKSQTIAWVIAAVSIGVALYESSGSHWDVSRPSILVVIIILLALYFVWKIQNSATAEDGSPMPLGDRRLLTGYLLVAGLVIVYMLVSLSALDFPEPAIVPEPLAVQETAETTNQTSTSQTQNKVPAGPNQNPTSVASPATTSASPNPGPSPFPGPVLQRIFPHYTLGNVPTVVLTLYGQNFKPESKVRFNMKPAPSRFVSSNLLEAPLEASQLVSVGSVTVDVENSGRLVSNAITVPVTRPRVALNVLFFWYPTITREAQLLLIVLFAGALGSYVHALKSLGDFIGNRTLRSSWFWWYITRPFLGMAMALIFYAVLRGGFLAGTAADAKIVSAFGVLTVGALVGMFADKAAQKLAEVFDVVFKAPDTRGGKLDAPVIDKLNPD